MIYIMPTLGLLPLDSILWSKYFVTTQTIWRVPIEFYITIVAAVFLTARRSIHWSILLCTVLLSINLGMMFLNPRNTLLWITILTGVICLHNLSASFTGNLKTVGKELFNDIRRLRRKSASVWKLAAVIFAGAFVINYLHNTIIVQTSEEARDELFLKLYNNARAKLPKPDGIRLKIFTDYQCPACSQLVPKYLETATATGGGAIYVELRDFPLDSACNDLNPSRDTLPHPSACSAAYAVRLAERDAPDKVNDFRTWLYTSQTKLDDDVILQKLYEIGIHNPQDMFDPELKQMVRTDLQEAGKYGIKGIPSLVLNGVLLPPGLSLSRLEMLLNFEMGVADGNVR